MLHKGILLINVGKKGGSYRMVAGGNWVFVGWLGQGSLPGSELTPITFPNGQELYALISSPNSPQTTVNYYGNKIDSITITRLDTNQSVTCPYYTQADGGGGQQNMISGVSLFSNADIGKEIWLNITIP